MFEYIKKKVQIVSIRRRHNYGLGFEIPMFQDFFSWRLFCRCWGDHWVNATGEEMDLNPHIPKPVPAEPEKKEEEEKVR